MDRNNPRRCICESTTSEEIDMISPIRMTQFGMWKFGRALWRNRWKLLGVIGVPAFLLSGMVYLYFAGFTCGGDSNHLEAEIQMGNIKQSLDMYYTRTDPHEYPESLDQLVDRNIMKEVPSDPWGQPYVYARASESEFVLFSAGPDGIAATDDDVLLNEYRD
ncbi:MAG: type II secretion system protein GspG [Persicimonas sp.]